MWSAVVEMQSHRTTVPHYDRENDNHTLGHYSSIVEECKMCLSFHVLNL